MKAEIKDSDEYILSGLRLAGFNINKQHTELILNVVDYVKQKKGDVTLRDIIELRTLVKSLFEE